MDSKSCKLLKLIALSGFLAVALGAFGAHYLKSKLDAYHLGVFETGVRYQFYHTLAAMFCLLINRNRGLLNKAATAFLAGILIFSGSLYCLALFGVKKFGAVTPIGGFLFLFGWLLVFRAAGQAKE